MSSIAAEAESPPSSHTDLRTVPTERVALLLQNTVEFPSLSMKRYAASLADALRGPAGAGWHVEMPEVHEPVAATRFIGRSNISRWGRLVRYPRRVRQFRKQLKPAVCHVLDHSHANLLTACDPNTSVATIHDLIPMLAAVGELDFKVSRAMRQTFALKLKRIARCKRIIAISQSTKRQLLRFADVPAERVEVVYHGVADEFVPLADEASRSIERASLLSSYKIDPGGRVMLHVCTPNRYKNTPALLHALAKLPGDVSLLRVGAPMFDDEIALADRLGVTARVINAGSVTNNAGLAGFYRSADVFVFPSLFEGFGWPPLEAMACGTPVVLSDAASLPEVGGDAALYAAPHDHTALAAAIDRLLSGPAEHARRRAACMAHASMFTWDRCARHTASVYAEVAIG